MNRNHRNDEHRSQRQDWGADSSQQRNLQGQYESRASIDRWSEDDDYAAGQPQRQRFGGSGQSPYAQQGQQFDAYPQDNATYASGPARPERYEARGAQYGGNRQFQGGEPRPAHGLPRQGAGPGRSAQWMEDSMQEGYGNDQARYGQVNQGYGNPGQGHGYQQQGYGSQQYGSDRDLQWGDSGRGYATGGRQQSGFGGQQGSRGYAGVGPKNYTRSDERIREDLCERICDAWDVDASDIDIQVRDGVATLTGTVRERAMKHRAEDLVGSVNGVKDVENQLRVSSNREPGGNTASSATAGATTAAGKAGTTTPQTRAN